MRDDRTSSINNSYACEHWLNAVFCCLLISYTCCKSAQHDGCKALCRVVVEKGLYSSCSLKYNCKRTQLLRILSWPIIQMAERQGSFGPTWDHLELLCIELPDSVVFSFFLFAFKFNTVPSAAIVCPDIVHSFTDLPRQHLPLLVILQLLIWVVLCWSLSQGLSDVIIRWLSQVTLELGWMALLDVHEKIPRTFCLSCLDLLQLRLKLLRWWYNPRLNEPAWTS